MKFKRIASNPFKPVQICHMTCLNGLNNSFKILYTTQDHKTKWQTGVGQMPYDMLKVCANCSHTVNFIHSKMFITCYTTCLNGFPRALRKILLFSFCSSKLFLKLITL